jgi:hypothetical protein
MPKVKVVNRDFRVDILIDSKEIKLVNVTPSQILSLLSALGVNYEYQWDVAG